MGRGPLERESRRDGDHSPDPEPQDSTKKPQNSLGSTLPGRGTLLSRHLPRSRAVRVVIGFGFIAGGFLGALPILGFWMIPVGIVILSIDVPWLRALWLRASARLRLGIARGAEKR